METIYFLDTEMPIPSKGSNINSFEDVYSKPVKDLDTSHTIPVVTWVEQEFDKILKKSGAHTKYDFSDISVAFFNSQYYNIPDASKEIINALEVLSDDKVGFDEIKKRINQIPQFEMERLCKLVKEDIKKRNPSHRSTDKKGFEQQTASICYIALQEGILPSVLYLICVMNWKHIKD